MIMKYLKKFNEELNPETYSRAAEKFKSHGHYIRSFKMQIHKLRQLCKEFGKVNLNYQYKEVTGEILNEFNGDFYLHLELYNTSTGFRTNRYTENTEYEITFGVFLIPATKKEEDLLINNIKIYSDKYWKSKLSSIDLNIGEISISYKDDIPLKFKSIFKRFKNIEVNRRFAVVLKKQLMACFSPGEYPILDDIISLCMTKLEIF